MVFNTGREGSIETEAAGLGFPYLHRDLARVNTLKKAMFDRYYYIKTESICYIPLYFLHYFVSSFDQCLANAIITDYAHSGAMQ